MRHPASCSRCGRPFAATRSDARYCGKSCKQLAYLARRFARVAADAADAARAEVA